MSNKLLTYIVMILPPLFWAGNFIVGRALADQVTPITLSFWRWFIALLFLFPFILKPIWYQRHTIRKNFLKIALLSVLSVSAFNTLAYIALQDTTATNATLLNSFIPIFILLISALFMGEKISARQIMGILVSLVGVLIILSKLDSQVIRTIAINKGDVWMLIATLDWAIYSILLKNYRPPDLSAIAFLGMMIIIGTIVLLPLFYLNPFNEKPIIWNPTNSMALLYIAVFPSIIAYLAWNYGIKKLGASRGGQFIHLMPFFGAILAVIFLQEKIMHYHWMGGLFIALGLWLSLRKKTG